MHDVTVLTGVGIDIGTTTTKLIVSKLTFANVMPGSRVPKIEISAKSVFYVGNIHLTPYTDRKHVNGKALQEIISGEYDAAGIVPAEVDTGAVIITGEAARKENAAEIVHSLTRYAGDFVVATAGPDLESLIAGKGSGAEELSKQLGVCIANIDIGGGTTNISYFNRGKCLGTACIRVGGRLFEVDPHTQRLAYLAPPARRVVDYLQETGRLGPALEAEDEGALLQKCLAAMVAAVERVVLQEPLQQLDNELVMTNSLPPAPIGAVVFSGGVSRYVYRPREEEWWIHGDAGPLLAQAFRRSRIFTDYKVLQGKETIHATVLGAGAHTINVSGSTITVSPAALPLRNLPAVYPEMEQAGGVPSFSWLKAAKRFSGSFYPTVALVIPPLPDTKFATITRLAEQLVQEIPLITGNPKVIVARQDIAKVLGQALQVRMGEIPLVCLDGISLQAGDYLDIAKPLPCQDAVPVIVKTLVFSH